MKIKILTTEFKPYPGGVATYVYNIATELSRQGHDVTVVVFFNYGEKVETNGYEFKVVSVFSEDFRNYKLFKLAFWLAEKTLKDSSEIWIAADYRTMIASSYLPYSGRKYCVMHGTDSRAKLVTIFNKIPFFSPLSRFKKVVCNSDFTKKLVINNNKKVDRSDVVVSYLGAGDAKKTDMNFRNALGVQSKFVLLSVGRIERRKGIEYSIKAVLDLPEDIKNNLVYFVVGKVISQEYKDLIVDLIGESNSVVRYLGVVDEELLTSLYQESNVFLHTAVTDEKSVEGFGLVLAEAAKYGLPVITTGVDAIPEVVVADKTGFVVNEKDINAIASKIKYLYYNRDVLNDMSAFAKEHSNRFNWKEHVKVFFDE